MATTPKRQAYSAEEVAKYFIYLASQPVSGGAKEREGLTNLKLQKILYFAQAYFLSKVGRPLFADPIEAWGYGPVVPTIYHHYKRKGSSPIFVDADTSAVSDADKEVLQKIWSTFGGYSANRLVDITHAHSPWKDAYASTSKVITNKALAEYYTPLLSK